MNLTKPIAHMVRVYRHEHIIQFSDNGPAELDVFGIRQ